MSETSGPVIVCLDRSDDVELLVRCGLGLSQAWNAPLYVSTVVVVPQQLPIQPLAPEEVEAANALLDSALFFSEQAGVQPIQELVVGRSWTEAAAQAAIDLSGSALVIGVRPGGPLGLLDRTRVLRRLVPCPVIAVGAGQGSGPRVAWPPVWLAEAHLSLR